MWLAARHEGFDRVRSSVKNLYQRRITGTILDKCSRGFLRSAMAIKVISMLILFMSHYAYGGLGFFTWDLSSTSETMRESANYRSIITFANILYFIGSIYMCSFQNCLADDAAWSRGYRAGSKILSYSCFFDIVSSAIQLAWSQNFSINYTHNFWAFFNSGSLDWIFFATARAIQGFSLILLGFAFFLLEVYHDEGTNDWHGPLNLLLFSLAGSFEICRLLAKNSTTSAAFTLLALISGLIWAIAFEDEVNATSPALNETELCNELEKEITEFTQVNPNNI